MKILWITNIPLPEAKAKLTGNPELKATGGWLIGAANALLEKNDVQLYVASVSSLVNKLEIIEGNKVVHFLIPFGNGNEGYNKDYESFWQDVQEMVRPDVVHIHGTEYTHGLSYVRACGSKNVVVSIQGMKSVYARYYLAGICAWDVLRNMTFHDCIKGGLFRGQRLFEKTGRYEVELLKSVNHIIGRTSWDRSNTWAINPEAKYHFCNETLRDPFYNGDTWSFETCVKHRIFVSQANYPIKGFHQLVKALPIILRQYPDTTVHVAGADPTTWKGFSGFLHYNGYGRYLKRLIQSNNVQDAIHFVGALDAEQMKREYLNCNVFVSPSAIENSPNSLGEAQILGTPCISSYVGGVRDMMIGNEENMYRFEEVEMLADKIVNIFSNPHTRGCMMEEAKLRHSPRINSQTLYNIYQQIVKE